MEALDSFELMTEEVSTSEYAWGKYCAADAHVWTLVGELLISNFDERSLADTNEWLHGYCDDDPGSWAAIGATLQELGRGLAAKRKSESGSALEALGPAFDRLNQVGSPLRWLARLKQGSSFIGTNSQESSRAALEPLIDPMTDLGYRSWAAEAHWGLGTVAVRQGRIDEGISNYQAGLRLLETGVSPKVAVLLKGLLGDALAASGDYERALRHGVDALRELRRLPQGDRVFALCSLLATMTSSAGEWAASAYYRDCVVNDVERVRDLTYLADAHVWRALTHRRLDRTTEALLDLEKAEDVASRIADADEREQAMADVKLVRGFTQARSPALAADLLRDAALFYSNMGHRLNVFLAKVGLVDVELQLHRSGSVKPLLDELDVLYREIQAETSDSALAIALLGRGSVIADRRVRFELEVMKDEVAALAASDRSRITSAAELPTAKALARTAARLPAGVAVVAYAWLGGHPVIFLLRSGRDVEAFRPVDAPTVESIEQHTFLVPSPVPGGWESSAKLLYQALIAPLGRRLSGVDSLVIVPDGPLFAVPFSALQTPTGRYLVEDYSVSVVPSLRYLVTAVLKDGWDIARLERVAVFVEPVVSAGQAPVQLPGARAEVEILTRRFPEVVDVFTGSSATPSVFVHALTAYDLVHFGGHGQLVPGDPVRSFLMMAPDAAHPDGHLTAHELYGSNSPRTVLAVVASCGSAAGGRDLPEALALVRPLLDAGVTHVVGSLRPLSDRLSAELMETFYEQLTLGLSPAKALRLAQLGALESAQPGALQEWAYLQHFGYQLPKGETTP